MEIESVAIFYFSNCSYYEGVIKNEYLSNIWIFDEVVMLHSEKKTGRNRNDYVYERNDMMSLGWILEITKPIFIFQ